MTDDSGHRPDGTTPLPTRETIGAHDANCATLLIQLCQRVRALESETAARQVALTTLNASLIFAQSEVERLRSELKLNNEALSPAEARAASLQERLDQRRSAHRLPRVLRKLRRRLAVDDTAVGLVYRAVNRALVRRRKHTS